jgi:DNA recombination protein RmuC
MGHLLGAAAGLIAGAAFAWFYASRRAQSEWAARMSEAERRAAGAEATASELRRQQEQIGEELRHTRSELAAGNAARIRAETERKETAQRLEEEKRLLAEARDKLTDTFKALAGTTLEQSNRSFLSLARETFDKVLAEARGDLGKRQEAIDGLVRPMTESLQKIDEKIRNLDTSLAVQIKGLTATNEKLQKETANLVTALRAPQVRGRWGELTLKRVVELAGMSEHCDFTEQFTVSTDDGRIRPDLVVHLPAAREIVVDAKVSLEGYLEALSAESEQQRKEALARHAAQIRKHMTDLSSKRYWEQFAQAPELVIMFIPGESFFAAAVDSDHRLIEDSMEKRVVLATPTTLITALWTIAHGWKQEQIARNAQEISDLGKELYERMRSWAGHISDMGKGLDKANTAYNSAVGSLESRVLPSARRFKELGAASGDEIPVMESIDTQPRQIASPELKDNA